MGIGPFITEEDWAAAFRAAELTLRAAEAKGLVTFADVVRLRSVAMDVATAVIRSPVLDIDTEPGVWVDHAGDETNFYTHHTRRSA